MLAMLIPFKLALGHHKAYSPKDHPRCQSQECEGFNERRNWSQKLHEIQQVHNIDENHR